MFKNLKKQQFIVILFILLIILFLFIFSIINKESEKFDSLKELQKEMFLADSLSKVIHEIQKERGISSGYLASHGKLFKKELQQQRCFTNKAIKNITKKNLINKNKLLIIRKRIDNLSINVKNSINFYSSINETLLKRITNIAKTSRVPKITQSILAYSNFLYVKENAGIERAIGTVILSSKKFLKSNKIEFIKLIAMQELYLKKFYTYASDDFINYYEKNMNFPELKILLQIQDHIIKAESFEDLKITPTIWLKNMTIKIDKLKNISDYIENKIIINIQRDNAKSFSRYLAYMFINIILFIILLIIAIFFIKEMQKERRKRLLLEKYVINSSTDLKGNITYVSKAFCEISGYTEKELLGKPHNIVRHPDTPKSTFKEVWQTIQNKEIWRGRIKNKKKDGGYYWVYATIEPLLDAKGELEGYAAVRIDITNSVSLEQKIMREIEKNREKDQAMLHQSKLAQMGEMISMIAHQWRQPLSAISATSGSLNLKSQIGTLDQETTVELSNKITEYAQHLSATIDDFRNFFKDNKAKERTTLQAMLKSTLNIVEVSLENAKISVDVTIKSSAEIETYINEVKQVILNIIKNAEDVLLDKEIADPKITIEIDKNQLTIADNAGGIPDDIIEKIFEPYFSTKMQKDGTGLGLYMSKTIIEEHCGGKLSVKNNAKGAVFTICLPTEEREGNA